MMWTFWFQKNDLLVSKRTSVAFMGEKGEEKRSTIIN
jgi:hypothetical protein